MFVLGHLGIGAPLVRRWTAEDKLKALYAGCLLPDLIDKPLYYGLAAVLGRRPDGLIPGTRTFGHTALLLAAFALPARLRRSPLLAALALGIASHLLLDNIGDLLPGHKDPQLFHAFLWPLLGSFPRYTFSGWHEHLGTFWQSYNLWGELVGGTLLAREYVKSRTGS